MLKLLLLPQIALGSSIEIEKVDRFSNWKIVEPVRWHEPVTQESRIGLLKLESRPLFENPKIELRPLRKFDAATTKAPSLKPIPSIADLKNKTKPTIPIIEAPIKEFTTLEYKLLQAELFFESKQYELALGLYLDIQPEVTGHDLESVLFKLSETALALDLYNDFKKWSFDLVDKPKYRVQAYKNLTSNIRSYDEQAIEPLINLEIKYKLEPPPSALQYRLLKAQLLSRAGKLNESLAQLEAPAQNSVLSAKINLLKAIVLYRLGRVDNALSHLSAIDYLILDNHSFELKNEALLLTARLYFQKGNYSQARAFYSRIDQNYIEWLPAMTEMGWAQILQGDFEGASGNMFSLHTDFFKNHFIPDSYLARTVGYLGLCQYGDALKTVIDLKGRYLPLVEKTRKIKEEWSPSQFYELVHLSLKAPKAQEVNGVPKVWVYYLTRDPNFIREQKVINSLEDEINSYNKFTLKIINLEKNNTARKHQLLKKQASSDNEREELYWTNLKLHVYKKSRDQMRRLRAEGLARINQTKAIHKQLAGLSLKQKMVDTHKSLLVAFEQVDLLQYEIFAGAGDQLRAVLSGLPVDPRSFASERGSKDPAQVKWEFKGEVWKDEIGYFRSSLKNICGESDQIRAANQKGESP